GAPHRAARYVEPYRDVGELGADRLVLGDGAAALHAKLRVVQRSFVGGAADADVECRSEGDDAALVRRAADGQEIAHGHAAVLELDAPAGAVIPARTGLRGDAQ